MVIKWVIFGVKWVIFACRKSPTLKKSVQVFGLRSVPFFFISRNYINKVVSTARHRGFIESIAGRRRYLPFINSVDATKRTQNERQAINTSIQGSAADIVKYAILRMERNISKYETSLKVNIPQFPLSSVNLVLHLHDELIYEVPIDKDKKLIKILKMSMENCAKLSVPLRVKIKKGLNWGNLVCVGWDDVTIFINYNNNKRVQIFLGHNNSN